MARGQLWLAGVLLLFVFCVSSVGGQDEEFTFSKGFLNDVIYNTLRDAIHDGNKFKTNQFKPLDVYFRITDLFMSSADTKGPELKINNYYVLGLDKFVDHGCTLSPEPGVTVVYCKLYWEKLTIQSADVSMDGKLWFLDVHRSGGLTVTVNDVEATTRFRLQNCDNAIMFVGAVVNTTYGELSIDQSAFESHDEDEHPTTDYVRKAIDKFLKTQFKSLLDYSPSKNNHGELYQITQEFYNVLHSLFETILKDTYKPVEVNPKNFPPNCKGTPATYE